MGAIVKLFSGMAAGLAVMMFGLTAKADGPTLTYNPYIGGAIGLHQNTYNSGGVVDFIAGAGAFPFVNSGLVQDENWNAHQTFGLSDVIQVGPVGIRAEAEVWRMPGQVIETGGFPGPPNPVFFYETRIDQSFGAMFNLWGDLRPFDDMPLIFSFGAGVGITNLKLNVRDDQADPFIGELNQSKLTYQLGVQVGYEINEIVTAGIGASYIDVGNLGVPLRRQSNNAPTGTYKLDWDSTQVMGFVRVDLNALDTAFSGN